MDHLGEPASEEIAETNSAISSRHELRRPSGVSETHANPGPGRWRKGVGLCVIDCEAERMTAGVEVDSLEPAIRLVSAPIDRHQSVDEIVFVLQGARRRPSFPGRRNWDSAKKPLR